MPQITENEFKIFCDLADPLAKLDADCFDKNFKPDNIIYLAELHNVQSIILRKLKTLEKLNSLCPTERYNELKAEVELYTIVSMDLDSHRKKITNKFLNEKIPHRVVKGYVFARELYPYLSDRTYSDVDILVPETHFQNAIKILQQLDYTPLQKDFWDNSENNKEFKFGFKENDHILIELHTDLVHMKALRRKKQLNFERLETAYNISANQNIGHFILAVVHASLGHKFHNLKLLIDVLQALRNLSKTDINNLVYIVEKQNLKLEVLTCLYLCAALFKTSGIQEKCDLIRAQFENVKIPKLIRRIDVLTAPLENNFISKWRRRAFRLYQLTGG